MDYGHKATDKMLQDLLRQIDKDFKAGADKISKDTLKTLEKMGLTEKGMQGIIQANKNQRLSKLVDIVASDISRLITGAQLATIQTLINVYTINYQYATYELCKGALLSLNFKVPPVGALKVLFNDMGVLSNLTFSDLANKKLITNEIKRQLIVGVKTGLGIVNIARNVKNVLGGKLWQIKRIIQTEVNAVQAKSRLDSYDKGQELGLKVKKQWISTVDGRTRERHRKLFQEVRPLDKPFSNGLMYPGDPAGKAEEVINCRCTIVSVFEGYSKTPKEQELDRELADMAFEEWRTKREF